MNKKGDILFGKIVKIDNLGLNVLTRNKILFFIPKKNVSDWAKINLEYNFRIGETINFIVEEIDFDSQKGIGNFKVNHPLYFRSPFKDSLQNTKHGFQNLKDKIESEISNWKKGAPDGKTNN